ncbi:MAG: ABC transporter ATP-binding protein, partial [Acidimicrobiia bacterium]
QQQMLALGRAYMSAPRLLMIDELSLGLAPRVVDEVADMVRSLTEATDVGLLVVEQNAAVAVELTERTYVMRNGAIVGEYKSPALAGDDALMLQYLG